jgi:Tfp pilus assembly protein PilF
LAKAYFQQDQFSSGVAELQRALELDPQNAEARMVLGAAYLEHAQPKPAQDEFAQLLAHEPNNAEAHVGSGMALADEGNHQAAIEEYKTALKLDPQASDVLYKMGVSQLQLKQYDEAIATFLQEQQRKDNYELETALADAYQAKGLTQQAQQARTKAAQLKNRTTD